MNELSFYTAMTLPDWWLQVRHGRSVLRTLSSERTRLAP